MANVIPIFGKDTDGLLDDPRYVALPHRILDNGDSYNAFFCQVDGRAFGKELDVLVETCKDLAVNTPLGLRKLKTVCSMFYFNLIAAYQLSENTVDQCIIYMNLHSSDYKHKNSNSSAVSYNLMKKVLFRLAGADYIVYLAKGSFSRKRESGRVGERTSITFSERFADLYIASRKSITVDIVSEFGRVSLMRKFKDDQGFFHQQQADLTTSELKPWRKFIKDREKKLKVINDLIDKTEVKLLRNPFPKHQLKLNSKFTGTLDRGGRLYAGYQQRHQYERLYITINEKETVELDYKALHPTMAYHSKGLRVPPDCYDVHLSDNVLQDREICKAVLMRMLNSKRPLLATRQYFSSLTIYQKEKPSPPMPLPAGMTADEVYERIRSFHAPIASLFGEDKGAEYQKLDSEIALEICYSFAQRGILCLPVHDSFIISVDHKDALLEMMQLTYKKYLGQGIKVEVKDPTKVLTRAAALGYKNAAVLLSCSDTTSAKNFVLMGS